MARIRTGADRTAQQAVTLSGAALGLVGGYMPGRGDQWTRRRRDLPERGALIGVGWCRGRGCDSAAADRYGADPWGGSTRTSTTVSLPVPRPRPGWGAAAGMFAGRMLVANWNFTTSQGTLLTLSPLAGGLLGLGITYLATPEQSGYNRDPSVPWRIPTTIASLPDRQRARRRRRICRTLPRR
jgi:hypothetical protein